MKFLGNVIWFLTGGVASALMWLLAGLLCCITIVGIPLGKQCFKFAGLAASPFGRHVNYGGGAPSFLANIVWIVFCGIGMALSEIALGIADCCTIILIPFGLQHFKLAKLSLMPFGAKIERD